jgi:large subunit ribosomal protein L22
MLISKTLRTAIADAEHNFSLDTNSLVIKEATIGAGPTLRRFKPRAKGAAGPILRRTSHIRVTLTGAAQEKKARKVSASKASKPKTESVATEDNA